VPRSRQCKSEVIGIRVTPGEKGRLTREADRAGMATGEYVRHLLRLRTAKRPTVSLAASPSSAQERRA
jgi:hypothetical protein